MPNWIVCFLSLGKEVGMKQRVYLPWQVGQRYRHRSSPLPINGVLSCDAGFN